ncbi:MAG: FAD-binding protein [Prevotella sp.]|nr:FAD-binding protein [Bacteroides sp.]MCM1366740.1 FAD-binding protein [Prevotella sp.]MCM1437022.1 FAD-binding protein [Prevotella sp.]
MITTVQIRVSPQVAATPSMLGKEVSKRLGIPQEDINDIVVIRQSIDARKKPVVMNLTVRVAADGDNSASVPKHNIKLEDVSESKESVIIVGAGPAGLFAALKAIELGIKPIVLERGKEVEKRIYDLAAISRNGIVDCDSNYCFGEGGAGAFSDGKLFTRSKKKGNVDEILQLLVQYGASEKILCDAHPHIGSDKLPRVIRNIRESIINHGGEVHFNTRVTDLIISDNTVKGVIVKEGKEYFGPVILATGHSARDVYEMLDRDNVAIEAKGIAIGVRLEHPQSLIDKIQYHSPEGRGKWLPAAEYSFVTQSEGRGVYSFCMCPGGVIVPAASAPGELVVNGMSASGRSGKLANSGMVVQILPGDFPEFSHHGALEIMELQRWLERVFFEAAGKTLIAPAQRMTDFVEKRISKSLPRSSYPPGIISKPLHELLPPFISERLREGFKEFGKKSKGFLTNDACMIGLESRTSAPVRIPRNKDTLEHVELKGFFPCGEGAGYAGGIVSAAIDGQRCASQVFTYFYNHNPHGTVSCK